MKRCHYRSNRMDRVASLAGIIPPGTLVVVTGITTNVHPTPMMSFDWNLPSFYDAEAFTTLPSANVIEIANEAAENMIVLPLTPPGPNSSFSLQFYGPSVQCSAANTSQQAVFDYYQNTLARALIYTKQTYEEGNFTSDTQNQNAPAAGFPVMLVLSAFAPYEGIQGWLVGNRNPTSVDALNNWNIDLPWGSLGGTGDDPDETPNNPNYPSVVQQLWVQTTDQSFVCMMGNASYNVDFGFVDGVQTMIQYTTSDFQPLSMARLGGDGNPDEPGPYEVNHQTGFEYTYMSVFMAFTSLISGNVSTTITAGYGPDQTSNATLFDSSSRALLNGLSVCDDFLNNYWTENPIGWNYSSPAPYNKSEQTNDTNLNVLNNLFEKPAWMCRNRTLMRAVEDLANNITISMLSSSNLT